MLIIKKVLIALITSVSVTTAVATPAMSNSNFQDPYHQSEEEELLLKQKIRQNIDSDSIYYKTHIKYHYASQEFQSYDAVVNKF